MTPTQLNPTGLLTTLTVMLSLSTLALAGAVAGTASISLSELCAPSTQWHILDSHNRAPLANAPGGVFSLLEATSSTNTSGWGLFQFLCEDSPQSTVPLSAIVCLNCINGTTGKAAYVGATMGTMKKPGQTDWTSSTDTTPFPLTLVQESESFAQLTSPYNPSGKLFSSSSVWTANLRNNTLTAIWGVSDAIISSGADCVSSNSNSRQLCLRAAGSSPHSPHPLTYVLHPAPGSVSA